ncbi:MAG: glycosyltransferase [Gammaproteobacteria bacterium]
MRPDSNAPRTLVLYADYTTRLSYFDDWLDAFDQSPLFLATAHNICARGAPERIGTALREADLVVLLHSTNGDTTAYMEPFVSMLQARRALLLSFVGNEVNLPGTPIGAKRALFARIEPDFIATQLPLDAGQYLFGDRARRAVIAVPHALNPRHFRPVVPDAARDLDIGVRSVRYLAHLGDEDRNRAYDHFLAQAGPLGLRVDIGTERLARDDWAAFLNRCLGTVSTEAGSWFLERDDRTVDAIRRWTDERTGARLVIRNDSPLQRIGHRLPWRARVLVKRLLGRGFVRHESGVAEALPFDEVYARFFRDRERPSFYGKCISSRHFDAIGTRTCQIMIRGRFNDILRADEHYIALDPDFANAGEAVRRLKDEAFRCEMVDRALAFALDAHTYAHRMAELHAAIARAA